MAALDRLIARHGPRARANDLIAALPAERPPPQPTGAQKRAEAVAAMAASLSPAPQKENGNPDAKQVEASSAPAPAAEQDGGINPPRPSGQSAQDPRPQGPASPQSSTLGAEQAGAVGALGKASASSGDAAPAPEASPPSAGQADRGSGEEGPASSDESPLREIGDRDDEGAAPDQPLAPRPRDGGPESSSPGTPEEERQALSPSEEPDATAADDTSSVVPKGTVLRVPVLSFGGNTAASWAAIRRIAATKRREVRAVERALRRLIARVDLGGVDPTPRVDGRKLVRELVIRRVNLARVERREGTLPIVVLAADVSGSCSAVCDETLAADVSGSCSAVCDETLAAAVAIAEDLDEVVVVRHSNGILVDAVGAAVGNRAGRIQPDQAERLADFVGSLRRPVAAVVAWGDQDAGHDYAALCARGADTFLLDSYAARHGARPASAILREAASGWARPPKGWWQGVNDAATSATALRAMAAR
jgi:hypothetical protein